MPNALDLSSTSHINSLENDNTFERDPNSDNLINYDNQQQNVMMRSDQFRESNNYTREDEIDEEDG